jgi:Asp-tRNA(Asn)/Glu-tRNA(Gln) amidotransferase A subunit family amidase
MIDSAMDILKHIAEIEERFASREEKICAFVPEEGRFERLRREARDLIARYPDSASRPAMFGVLTGVKDIFHVDGFPTRAGSRVPEEELVGVQDRPGTRIIRRTPPAGPAAVRPRP